VQAPLLVLLDEVALLETVVLELELDVGPVLEEAVVLLELLVPLLVDELELVVVAGIPPVPPVLARPPLLELPELAGAPPDAPDEPPVATKLLLYTEQDATTNGTPKAATSKPERIGAIVSEAFVAVDLRQVRLNPPQIGVTLQPLMFNRKELS
jgi:hypothetical protein